MIYILSWITGVIGIVIGFGFGLCARPISDKNPFEVCDYIKYNPQHDNCQDAISASIAKGNYKDLTK